MSIDLSKLSAKELYELAQKKEQEEQEQAQRQAKLNELNQRREEMLSEHKSVLALTDKKIRDMQAKREQLVAEQEQTLKDIDKEIAAQGGVAQRSAPVSTGKNDDELKKTIRQVMLKRDYISSTLLKEKLAAYGVKLPNFNKDLEQWVRDGWFISKGKGNYALGKKI